MFSKLTTYFSFLSLVVLFSSCRDMLDHVDKIHPKKGCKLSSISFVADSSESGAVQTRSRLWTFNESGEPISSIVPMTFTGNPNARFLYDSKGNLTTYVIYYGEDIPVMPPVSINNKIHAYHVYTSDAKGNIATDSVYARIPLEVYYVSTFKYDNKNRMIEWKSTEIHPRDTSVHFTTIQTFSYNAQGNLEGRTYDNRVNFKSKSKVLQFLTRDYSINNPLTDEFNRPLSYEYNHNQLPVQSSGGSLIPPYLAESSDWGKNTITYQCR